MSRAALPTEAVRFTPGYSWRLDLDIRFDGERPDDWPAWTIRMHIWTAGQAFTLTNDAGVTFEEIAGLPGGAAVIPVIVMSVAQTEALRDVTAPIQYLIDLKAPEGEAEDYFAGALAKQPGPPAELLT
ncbi:hypothetical protein DEM27_31865 [Metarhizobium album]|uniref:Uncharacterized protein n=1 Tax=Metarhizobium album TaxID=2182425 RepID=A0A2U2DFZ9_9HYPH|nr:hypothetical protein [Rhizobium album]PWE52246.1 hypothetical protein DEM27_31865 [Rhizobium album]